MRFFFLLFVFPLFAHYNVEVDQDQDFVAIYLETIEEKSSICPLILYSFEIKRPMPAQKGQILLKVGPDLETPHLQAFGKRKGRFLFQKGKYLPQLKEGAYLLKINQKTCGVIHVGE